MDKVLSDGDVDEQWWLATMLTKRRYNRDDVDPTLKERYYYYMYPQRQQVTNLFFRLLFHLAVKILSNL